MGRMLSTKTKHGIEFDEEVFAVVVALGAGIQEIALLYLMSAAQLLSRIDQRDRADIAASRLVRLQLTTDQSEAIELIGEVAGYVTSTSMNPCCIDDCGSCHGCKVWKLRRDSAEAIQYRAKLTREKWGMVELHTCKHCLLQLPGHTPCAEWGMHLQRFHPDQWLYLQA